MILGMNFLFTLSIPLCCCLVFFCFLFVYTQQYLHSVTILFLSAKPLLSSTNFHSIFGVSLSASFLIWEVALLSLFFPPPHLPVLLPVADRQKCQLCLGLRALCHEFNTAVQVQYTWIVQLLLMNQNLTLQRAGN